jgi:hypothetical protein
MHMLTYASARANFHLVGTAAMMPRVMGGAVDTNLMVYGTAIVRVARRFIFPVPGLRSLDEYLVRCCGARCRYHQG